jgi:hypothetical protein
MPSAGDRRLRFTYGSRFGIPWVRSLAMAYRPALRTRLKHNHQILRPGVRSDQVAMGTAVLSRLSIVTKAIEEG